MSETNLNGSGGNARNFQQFAAVSGAAPGLGLARIHGHTFAACRIGLQRAGAAGLTDQAAAAAHTFECCAKQAAVAFGTVANRLTIFGQSLGIGAARLAERLEKLVTRGA